MKRGRTGIDRPTSQGGAVEVDAGGAPMCIRDAGVRPQRQASPTERAVAHRRRQQDQRKRRRRLESRQRGGEEARPVGWTHQTAQVGSNVRTGSPSLKMAGGIGARTLQPGPTGDNRGGSRPPRYPSSCGVVEARAATAQRSRDAPPPPPPGLSRQPRWAVGGGGAEGRPNSNSNDGGG